MFNSACKNAAKFDKNAYFTYKNAMDTKRKIRITADCYVADYCL